MERALDADNTRSSKTNILDILNLDKALRLASKKFKNGQIEESKNIYEDILQKYSKNKQALIALKLLARGATVAPQDPPSGQLQPIINLYTQGQLQQALSNASQMLEEFPNSVVLYNIAGASNAGLMQFDDAVDCYKQALKIKPDFAEAYNNMGNVLKDKGESEAAIDSYKQALKIKPDFAEAYNNMGIILKNKGELEAAIDCYKKALKIKPDYVEAYNNMGIILKNKGKLEAAIDCYKKALQFKPGYAEAYYNMGAALQDKGDPVAAIDSYKKAIKFKPSYAEAYNNMGNALNGNGETESAIDCYKQALKIKPDNADAYNNMGVALKDKGDPGAAIVCYKQALRIRPAFAEAYNNMGIAQKDKDEPEAAIDCYKQALKIKPDYAEAYNNMGNALMDKGEPMAAIDSYKKALQFKPNYAEAYYNMGAALQDKGDPVAAIDSYKKAIKFKPSYAVAYNNMGIALKDKNDPEAAIDCFKQALKIKPDNADAYNNMGVALKDKGDPEAAIDCFKQALKIKPDFAEAYNNMGNALRDKGERETPIDNYKKAIKIKPDFAEAYNNMGIFLKDKGELDSGIKSFEMALKIKPDYQTVRANKLHQQSHICDWTALEQDRELIATLGTSTESIVPFGILSLEDEPERHRVRSKTFMNKLCRYKMPLPPAVRPSQKPQRLSIGYFSEDYQEHPVAYLMAKVLETHDRERFKVCGYSIGPTKEDGMRQRLISAFDVFNDVHDKNDHDVALLARQDKIDIAIDLTGLTNNHRAGIFAYRAAPVQINYLGYPGTMGADFIDYIIADPVMIPSGYEQYYDESILRLPNTYMPTDNTRQMSMRPMTRSEMGLPDAAFVFCCFNNNYKISPREFDIWMRILLKIEGSVLWLRNSNAWSEKNLRTHAETRGVDPSRLVFADRVPMDEHLARQKLADLFFDTFAFNAHTTASEALWAGLPVVTKIGKGFSARVAASLLTAVGLPELITETEQDYEALILHLATNPERLAQIRQKLSDNRLSTPLFDTELFTKNLEDGYQQAYQRYYDGKPPKDIFVSEIEPQVFP